MSRSAAQPFLRDRRTHARVTNEELFFDLIYAFAITQLSHRLLGNLTPLGAVQTLVLWFAVWLGWQYTCWITNWFNPENLRMRLMLFAPHTTLVRVCNANNSCDPLFCTRIRLVYVAVCSSDFRSPRPLNAPPMPQELEHISFVWLVPGNLHR